MCATILAIILFALEFNGVFSVHAMAAVYDLHIVLSLTFMFCYLSEVLTADLCAAGDIFYDLAWFQLPVKAQLLVKPTMQCSQREFRLNGIGFVDCSLHIFGKVIGSRRPPNHTHLAAI